MKTFDDIWKIGGLDGPVSKSQAKRQQAQSNLPFFTIYQERKQLIDMLLDRGWEQLGDTQFVAPGSQNVFTFVNAIRAELKSQGDR